MSSLTALSLFHAKGNRRGGSVGTVPIRQTIAFTNFRATHYKTGELSQGTV